MVLYTSLRGTSQQRQSQVQFRSFPALNSSTVQLSMEALTARLLSMSCIPWHKAM